MIAYRVDWAVVARNDLDGIALYIADDSPINALRMVERIEKRAAALRTFPERGRIVAELRSLGQDRYREIIESPWRLVYRIEGYQVLVVSVLDSRRDLSLVLHHRFLS